MSKVNRFMSPVQTQYQQTYVSQFVPLPFELMQKKADRQQEKFDNVKDFWKEAQEKMNAKVDLKDQSMNQSEIYGIQDQVEKALNQANGDWSQLDNIVRNASKEWNNYLKTDEGYTATTNKVAMDANMKEVVDSDMDAFDKQVAEEVGKGGYRSSEGAIGGVTYQGVPTYENDSEWQKTVLSAVKGRVKDVKGRANAGYIQDGKLIFNGTITDSGVSKEDIREITEGIIYNDTKWLNKTKWQFDNYKKAGRLRQDVTIDQYRDSVFEDSMKESFTGMSYQQHVETSNVKESKRGSLEGEEKYYDKFTLNLGGEYNAIKNSSAINALANEKGNAVNYLNKKNEDKLRGTTEQMSSKLNMTPMAFNKKLLELGYGESKDGVVTLSNADQIQFFNDILDPNFETSKIHKVPGKVDELKVHASEALKSVEHNELVKLQALENFVGKNYTQKEYDVYETTVKNRIKGLRQARDIATDPNASPKQKENAYKMIKVLEGNDMAESYKKFKNTFEGEPEYTIWDIYWDLPGIGDTPGPTEKRKLEGNENSYLQSLVKSERLLKSKELGFEISENAEKRRDSAVRQGWMSQLPFLKVNSDGTATVDEVASRGYAISVNRNLKQRKDKVLEMEVARPSEEGPVMIPLKEALRKDAKEASGGNVDVEEKIYQSYMKDFENTGSVNNPKTMPFTFSKTNPDVFIYGNYELNTDNSLDMSTIGELPISTKAVMKHNRIVLSAVSSELGETDLGSNVILKTGSHSKKKGDNINSKNQLMTGQDYDIIINLDGEDYTLPSTPVNGGPSQKDKFMKLYSRLTTNIENNVNVESSKKTLDLLLKNPLTLIK